MEMKLASVWSGLCGHFAGVLRRPVLGALLFLCWNGLALEAATRFKVASFNLENYLLSPLGTRPAKSDQAQVVIRDSIVALDADVIALQEVGGLPALQHLQTTLAATGLNYPHSELVLGADTNIQVAVLSKFPIIERHPHTADSFLLFGRRFLVSRGFAEVRIEVTPRYSFTLFTAHLKSRRPVAYADEAEWREEEALILRQKVEARLSVNREANLIVVGDFNDSKDSRPVRALIGRGRSALIDTRPAERNGDDQPNPNPRYPPRRITWTHHYGVEDSYSRIDYILISRGLAREWDEPGTYILARPNWGVASDHRPLVASFYAEDR